MNNFLFNFKTQTQTQTLYNQNISNIKKIRHLLRNWKEIPIDIESKFVK